MIDEKNILSVENLRLSFHGSLGTVQAVRGVSLTVKKGETLAIVGESGCGKTALCRSIMMLHAHHASIDSGRIVLCGKEVSSMTESQLEKIRGTDVSMIFQDPMSSLNPVLSIGKQIMEPLMFHDRLSRADAREKAIEILKKTGIDNSEIRIRQYPHHFSGGMRQRVAIAIAIACNPKLIIADEPTTALDIYMQEQIISLLKELCNEADRGMIFVTHDLSIAEEIADRIVVMKDGVIVEEGATKDIYLNPKHPYTRELLKYARYGKRESHFHGKYGQSEILDTYSFEDENNGKDQDIIVSVKNVSKTFALGKKKSVSAVKDFTMDVRRGKITGIVGASGCGKSTLARCIAGIYEPDSGSIEFAPGTKKQMIFQDSASALNPRMKLSQIIAEPLVVMNKRKGNKISKEELEAKIIKACEKAELTRDILDRHPYDVSGGQRQRAAIARALITEPDLIIADEPVSSLDVSTQAQIVHLLRKICDENDVAMIFISHDFPMVLHICDNIIDMNCHKHKF